jgi:RecB family exonuclease
VKPFAWSYSRLKNFEACPKRHWHIDIARDVKEAEGEALTWGNAVHKALANRIANGTALPVSMTHYEKWVTPLLTPQGNILVEQQLAIDADFGPTKWFSKDAMKAGMSEPWYRGVADVIKIVGPVALIIDWKTGKIVEDSQQLALMAACVFAHHPDVQKVRSEFIWLKEDARTRGDFHRNEMAAMWRSLWPRIEVLRDAHETTSYPAKPCYLCRSWCPVSACPHHGGE